MCVSLNSVDIKRAFWKMEQPVWCSGNRNSRGAERAGHDDPEVRIFLEQNIDDRHFPSNE